MPMVPFVFQENTVTGASTPIRFHRKPVSSICVSPKKTGWLRPWEGPPDVDSSGPWDMSPIGVVKHSLTVAAPRFRSDCVGDGVYLSASIWQCALDLNSSLILNVIS